MLVFDILFLTKSFCHILQNGFFNRLRAISVYTYQDMVQVFNERAQVAASESFSYSKSSEMLVDK